MKGKERVLNAIKCMPTDRTPWVPFVGCHAGILIGKSATEYLLSADAMFDGLSKAIELYKPDGIPVAFDLQLEAEVLGCDLMWSEQNPPAVISHPLSPNKNLDRLKLPSAEDGRLPIVFNTARRLRQAFGDLALYGLITGPFTLALHLLGTELFMQMLTNPNYVNEVLEFCEKVGETMAAMYIDSGCDIIAVVDPMTSQIGPEQFEEFISIHETKLFSKIRSLGRFSSFFVCGFAQQNIEVMCDCGPDNVSIDENIPLDYVKQKCLERGISFGGNLQLTVVLLNGTEADVMRNALTCMQLGGRRGFILSPGCDIPYATPPKNIQAVSRIIENPYDPQILELLQYQSDKQENLDLSDYGKTDRVIIDVITLDSQACAPCQYMVEAVEKAVSLFDGIVLWREHKIKNKEAVAFMLSLNVKKIPTICIDGKIAFVSKIPSKNELVEAIQERINEKFGQKIRSCKGEITVFGNRDENTSEVIEKIQKACAELGINVSVSVSDNANRMVEFGVIKTPAVVFTKHVVKAEGNIPSKDVIKEWIKEIS